MELMQIHYVVKQIEMRNIFVCDYTLHVVHLSWSLSISNSRGLNEIRCTHTYTDNITYTHV
jgi:hypothetical protein